MRILKQIIIENFQCHPKTVIDVAPKGLTIITGPTDHGKSAMVRAIKWLTTNRPQGDDFIRHGQTECKVTFEYNDGTTVQRRRTTSLNQYYVNEQLFEGFGTGVPLEVQQTTGVYVYGVADQTFYLNISEQLAGPFLGSSISAPLRAKILGKWAGTEEVDRANKKLGTDMYHAKQDKKRLEEDIYSLDAEVENYSWVKPLGEKLEKLEALQEQIQADSEKMKLLELKKIRLDNLNGEIEQIKQDLEWYYDVLPDVSQIISGIEPDMPLMIDLVKKDGTLKQLDTKIKAEKFTIQDCGQPEKAREILTGVEISAYNLTKIHGLSGSLLNVTHSIQYNEKQIIKCGQPTAALKTINNCNNHINTYTTLKSKKNEYVMCTQDIMARKISMTIFQEVDKAKNVMAEIDTKLNKLSDLQSKQHKYKERSEAFGKIGPNIELFHKVIKKSEDEIIQAKEDYKSVLKDSGVCPTCGGEIKEECLEHVI